MRLSIATKILNIADELDALGLYSEANNLTNLVRVAQMPGGANPAAGYAQPQQAPQTPPQATQQQAPKRNWQQEINKLTSTLPNSPNATNYPVMPSTPYRSPQMPPNQYGAPSQSAFNGWYAPANTPVSNSPAAYNVKPQLSNSPANPLTVVKDGVVQRGETMQEYMNRFMQNQQQTDFANDITNNARQMQIQKEMTEAQEKYWKLWQEQQNQLAGDGRPDLYQ